MFIFVLELELTLRSIFPIRSPYCQTSLLHFFIPSVTMLTWSNLVHTTFLVTNSLFRFSQSGIYPVRSVCFLVFVFCFDFRECFSSSVFPIVSFLKIHLYSITSGFFLFQFLFFLSIFHFHLSFGTSKIVTSKSLSRFYISSFMWTKRNLTIIGFTGCAFRISLNA